MKKQILILSAVLALSGCMTPQEQAARDAENARLAAIEAAKLEAFRVQYCTQIGAPQGSPNYYDCRMNLEKLAVQQDIAAKQIEASADESKKDRDQERWHRYEDQRDTEKFRKDMMKIEQLRASTPPLTQTVIITPPPAN